ncbi:retrotransposon protein, putative, ty1-copia subclass [Tanacetum coccineum]
MNGIVLIRNCLESKLILMIICISLVLINPLRLQQLKKRQHGKQNIKSTLMWLVLCLGKKWYTARKGCLKIYHPKTCWLRFENMFEKPPAVEDLTDLVDNSNRLQSGPLILQYALRGGMTVSDLHACSLTLKGLKDKGFNAERKLAYGDQYLHMGNGAQAVVEAIGTAISVNGVFEIDMNKNVTKNNNSVFSINKKRKLDLDSSYLWHCRLAHIGKTRMQKLQREGLLESINEESFDKCESCISGKMTKKPFNSNIERATDLLGLIHTDVFKAEVELQLGKKIKALRSDRGGEYLSKSLIHENVCSSDEEKAYIEKGTLCSAVGSLMYAAGAQGRMWRLSRLTCIENTKDMFLVYGGNPDTELDVTGFCDASWQCDKDDTKSQTGYVFVVNGGAVDWKSKKQTTIAMHADTSRVHGCVRSCKGCSLD